jgi:hypothetical protein
MKLRNKETGSIFKIEDLDLGNDKDGIWIGMTQYKSLAELNEVWEDYEEPKEYWRITDLGELKSIRLDQHHQNIEKCKQIGNYFETEEEAEKAVEKLKAWKRLKNKGFRFNRWTIPEEPKTPHIKLVIEAEMDVPDSPYDLDLLFGGKE